MVGTLNSGFSRLCNFLRPSCRFFTHGLMFTTKAFFIPAWHVIRRNQHSSGSKCILRIQSTPPGQPYLQTWQLNVIDYVSIKAISIVSLIQVFTGRLTAVVSMTGTETQYQLFFAEKITLPTMMMRETTGAALRGYDRVAYHA
jgi:hypothetical protein